MTLGSAAAVPAGFGVIVRACAAARQGRFSCRTGQARVPELVAGSKAFARGEADGAALGAARFDLPSGIVMDGGGTTTTANTIPSV